MSSPMVDWSELFRVAIEARDNAHAPYSQFRVGAAILTRRGSIHGGCNVENASYGLTVCAERVAIGAAVACGDMGDADSLVAVAVVSVGGVTPCGACRQVLAEFSRTASIRCLDVDRSSNPADAATYTIGELLPAAFKFE